MRIVFLGDSLTWGGYGGNFVAEIARLRPQHRIINAGASGNTVVNLLARLDEALAQNPDGVFVMVGGNDAISYSQPAVRTYYEHVQNIPNGIITPDLFARTYRELLTRIQLAHVLVWVGLETTEYSRTAYDALRQFNDLAREVARSLNVPVLDLMAHFRSPSLSDRDPITMEDIQQIGQRERTGWADYESERQRNGFTFTFDGMHFTPDSARKLAELIVAFLEL